MSEMFATTIKTAFMGEFSTWEQGERVKARRCNNGRFFIEREKWNGPIIAQNQCWGVPETRLNLASTTQQKGGNSDGR